MINFVPVPKPRSGRGSAISGAEQDRILDLFARLPLPEVRRLTGRPYSTLINIAMEAGL